MPFTPRRLFPAPLRRRTSISISAQDGGYVSLRIHRGDDVPGVEGWERYEMLTPNEALDVIEATVGDEWGF